VFQCVGPTMMPFPIRRWRAQPDARRMIRQLAAAAGIAEAIGGHTFRTTGITAYLANDGALEHAQEMAAHDQALTKQGRAWHLRGRPLAQFRKATLSSESIG
jgi:hypothetical protein